MCTFQQKKKKQKQFQNINVIVDFPKKIDKNVMQSSGMVGRVKQEVAIHSKLKHPSILELYTFFEDTNGVYLVLELAQNGELNRYLKENQRVSCFFVIVLFVT